MKQNRMEYIVEETMFEDHVKAIMSQENVSENKARMIAWTEGPVKGRERIKTESNQ